jgi:ATP-binding cassette subfamily B protein
MRRENRQLRGEIEEMSSRVSEMMDMLPVTRAHGAEDVEVERVGSQIEKVKESGIRVDVLNAVFGACMWVVLQVSQLTCLAFTGYLAYNGQIDLGDVVMYQGFFQMLLGAVNHMLGILPRVTAGFESIRSLGEVLECPDLEENEGKKQLDHVDGRFEFQDVSFEYPNANERSVADFSLTVESGECVALVGESGAGKSTIINLIIGFRRPTHGRILLDGMDMESLDLRTYRRHIAVVPQETILFSGSVRENITYGMEDVSDEVILRAVEIANLRDVVENLPEKLDTVIGESGCKLSGGQRQRLAIARAIIRDPRVILLDEATSSLDVVSEAAVQKAINQAIQGRTTFIVAHRLSTIRRADRIVVMKNGQCIERGTHDELLEAGGEFATLKSLQT